MGWARVQARPKAGPAAVFGTQTVGLVGKLGSPAFASARRRVGAPIARGRRRCGFAAAAVCRPHRPWCGSNACLKPVAHGLCSHVLIMRTDGK